MTIGQFGEHYSGTHQFNDSLNRSNAASRYPWVDESYWRAFPHMTRIVTVDTTHSRYLELQRRGIDKVLYFGSKFIYIDEKIRFTIYPDILLEEYSVLENKIVGWLGRDKYTDYISYIQVPTKRVTLIPFALLQLAWRINYSKWKEVYPTKSVKNDGGRYTTTNIPIPSGVLWRAICEAAQITSIESDIYNQFNVGV